LDFATVSDPHVRAALWSAFAALAVTLVLLAAVLAMRVRLLARLARERDAAARWIPLIARCTETASATLPRLSRRDADHFVLLWCRAQDSLRGQSQDHLREMAHRLGADVHVRRMFRSNSLRRRLVATAALGHLHARDLVPSLQTQLVSAPAVPSLVAAKALVRIDASIGVPSVLSVAVRRQDWPVASVATMLKECESDSVGPALSSAIRIAMSRGDDIGVERLLRLHITAETHAMQAVVRDVLAAGRNEEVLAAALAALSCPDDIAHARRLLGHPGWFVRVAAARALGRIGDKDDVARLATALCDSNWWVRHRAAQALAQLPGMNASQLSDIAARQTDRYAADMLHQILAERCVQ
jgi:HEAT repeat protein